MTDTAKLIAQARALNGHGQLAFVPSLAAALEAAEAERDTLTPVAESASALMEHDQICELPACLLRDGCAERARLFAIHDDAVYAYKRAALAGSGDG